MMVHRLSLLLLLAACHGADDPTTEGTPDPSTSEPPAAEPFELQVFDEVVFYDGYAGLVDAEVPEGVQRLRNDLITRRLTDEELDAVSDTLTLDVTIGALCDNYDRLGSVALAFVPAGSDTYDPGAVERIELGRYITPFMDMNEEPDQVGYHFDVSDVVPVLHDVELRARSDLWLELEVFGVPYAANEQIDGCEGRNDVFRGSLVLASEPTGEAADFDLLLPLTYMANFNNYQEGASDAVGTTTKTVPFTLPFDAEASQVVLVISNHGANAGGEEYERREHFVSVDGEELLTFVPGRETCEPFREVNTQPNGIYGSRPKTKAQWQSFSNWCPGDVIDTRVIETGALSAGEHQIMVDVPDAVFVDAQGNFPLSLYVQARE